MSDTDTEQKLYWIKVHSGLITDPEHRATLGVRIWLFLHMINRADWDTGTIDDWTDTAEADKLNMSVVTMRKQRRQLADRRRRTGK